MKYTFIALLLITTGCGTIGKKSLYNGGYWTGPAKDVMAASIHPSYAAFVPDTLFIHSKTYYRTDIVIPLGTPPMRYHIGRKTDVKIFLWSEDEAKELVFDTRLGYFSKRRRNLNKTL